MSFSISTGYSDPVEPSDVPDALKVAYEALPDNVHTPEHDELFQAALQAVPGLVRACGSGVFTVTMSGHANEGHKPKAGWANTHMTISISNQTLPVDADA